jgi:pimeloyl-ACP methyl ester carboxylesterase
MEEHQGGPNTPPHPLLFALEGQRALLEWSTLLPALPLLRRAPRGDGHPVLVLPGFGAGDVSTRVLRRYLRSLGYSAHPWKLGRNLGPRGRLPQQLLDRMRELDARHGRKLSVVGWSLGGIYARELARAAPERVRQVISLGSPFRGRARSSNVARVYRGITGRDPGPDEAVVSERLRQPPPVPSTAIYSKTDGVVAWEACVEEEADRTDNIEVFGSHFGLGVNPLVLYAIADRLSQPEDRWEPFDRSRWRRYVYA